MLRSVASGMCRQRKENLSCHLCRCQNLRNVFMHKSKLSYSAVPALSTLGHETLSFLCCRITLHLLATRVPCERNFRSMTDTRFLTRTYDTRLPNGKHSRVPAHSTQNAAPFHFTPRARAHSRRSWNEKELVKLVLESCASIYFIMLSEFF